LKAKYVLLIICSFFLITSNVYAASKEKLNTRIVKANNYLDEIMIIPETRIPSTLMKSCQGIIIMRQYRAGFIFGAKAGLGVALKRDIESGKWSPPSFVTSGEANFGLQIGGQAIDAVILIMNKSGLESLLMMKGKVGVNASIAVGPVGRDTDAKIGPDTAFLVYSKAKGLYGGLTFEGGVITQDNRANKKFYGRKVTLKELFQNNIDVPSEAKKLINTLEKYSKF
jgi:lipid-binding SYLF domain-containing protein